MRTLFHADLIIDNLIVALEYVRNNIFFFSSTVIGAFLFALNGRSSDKWLISKVKRDTYLLEKLLMANESIC